jgi:hypothetical protein
MALLQAGILKAFHRAQHMAMVKAVTIRDFVMLSQVVQSQSTLAQTSS